MRRFGSHTDDTATIDMTPLIDMVFILLIFFIVATSFVRESGVEVERPQAASAQSKEKVSMLVGVTGAGKVFIEGQEIDIQNVKARMDTFLAEVPAGAVVIVADKSCPTGITVQVLDSCRLAGVKNLSVAAKAGN
ncbi:ExbD/TolR family protein [Desulfotalea psychrophila]|uniref:Probable biopolymer transport protein (ExbD2) n=1 Tax=Desulfotalea psychrophila (strain LSv54 / DSM 12343) TaxID=177439 RepID=Q6AIX9_DESPS|nr:biopolymer transporter ExbD [Desulfotalea psychrophila]CAG37701.1 probable biopolymer transport protein (ExbD2) [Desulfotalea psychrophila LSv54]